MKSTWAFCLALAALPAAAIGQPVLKGGVSTDQYSPPASPPAAEPGPDLGGLGDIATGIAGAVEGGRAPPRARYDMPVGHVAEDGRLLGQEITNAARTSNYNDPNIPVLIDRMRDDETKLPYDLARPQACLGTYVGGWSALQQADPQMAIVAANHGDECSSQWAASNLRNRRNNDSGLQRLNQVSRGLHAVTGMRTPNFSDPQINSNINEHFFAPPGVSNTRYVHGFKNGLATTKSAHAKGRHLGKSSRRTGKGPIHIPTPIPPKHTRGR